MFGSPCGARGRVCAGRPRVGLEELTDINCASVVPRGRGNVPHLMAEVLLPTGLTGRGLITGKSAWLLTRAPFWITPRGTGSRRNMGSMGSMQEHGQSDSAFSEISSSSFFQRNFGGTTSLPSHTEMPGFSKLATVLQLPIGQEPPIPTATRHAHNI